MLIHPPLYVSYRFSYKSNLICMHQTTKVNITTCNYCTRQNQAAIIYTITKMLYNRFNKFNTNLPRFKFPTLRFPNQNKTNWSAVYPLSTSDNYSSIPTQGSVHEAIYFTKKNKQKKKTTTIHPPGTTPVQYSDPINKMQFPTLFKANSKSKHNKK